MAQDVRKHHEQQTENLKGWLRLALMPGKDAQRLCELVSNNTVELSALNTESLEELSRFGISPRQLMAFRRVTDQNLERCLTWRQEQGNFILTQDDPDFPDLLKTIHDPPAVLFGCGDKSILEGDIGQTTL